MNRDFPQGEWSVPIELAREPDFALGHFAIQPSLCSLALHGKTYTAEPRVMQALVALALRKGKVVSRDDLVQRCWDGRVVSEDAINRCIAKLRRMAELDGGASFSVETIPRVGFRLLEKGGTAAVPECSPEVETGGVRSSAHRARLKVFGLLAACLLLAVLAGVFVRYLVPANHGPSSGQQNLAAVQGLDAPNLPQGAVFRDCAIGCPEMVVIPVDNFLMGSFQHKSGPAPDHRGYSDNESPQHEVSIQKPFALARYDVTRGEFARFVMDTKRPPPRSCFTLTRKGLFVETIGASWQHPGFQQTQRDPVVCVNLDDAVAYTQWLSRRTGKTYRLPSEAEWEFAARAPSSAEPEVDSRASSSCSSENGADADYHMQYPGDPRYDPECHDGYAYTSPVGRFPANGFGLFDMLGNVTQWIADCYHPTYDGAPVDGSAWLKPGCLTHVLRGGYWASDPRSNRFARRGTSDDGARFSTNGFRVARDLY